MEFGIFILSVLGAFAASGVAAWLFVWPWLQKRSKAEGLSALLLPHAFRFIGLSFLVPGVVGAAMPSAFAVPAAWGDFAAAVLAILALVALAKRWAIALPLVWIFNIWGTADLLFAFYNGPAQLTNAGTFGATFYIPSLIVPALLVAHFLIFKLLLSRKPL
jgi:hypothetical protein